MVMHLWPSRARIVFNIYCYWSFLVLQNSNGTAIFLHSKEGVMQGGPFVTIVYGRGIIPLIKNLKQDIPDVTQYQYADNAGALGACVIIETYFDLPTRQGPGFWYYLKPSKSVVIVHPENLEAGK